VKKSRKLVAGLFASAALATGASPALAAPQGGPVVTGGLVNVTIVDAVDINRNTVQIPVAAAANVCNVDIAILLAQINQAGVGTCDAQAGSRANG
jgi:hypothetical protein